MKDNQRRAMFHKLNNPQNDRSGIKMLNSPQKVEKFNARLKVIRKDGVTQAERRELTIIQARARIMSKDKKLSVKERNSLKKIADAKINFNLFEVVGRLSGSLKRAIAVPKIAISKTRGFIIGAKLGIAKGFKESGGVEAEKRIAKAELERLKKKEELIELQRERAMATLEDKKDLIERREKISRGQNDIRKAQLEEKKALISETNFENQRLQDLREAEKQADKELFEQSVAGRVISSGKKTSGKIGRLAVKSFQQFDKQQQSIESKRRRKAVKRALTHPRKKAIDKKRKVKDRKKKESGFVF